MFFSKDDFNEMPLQDCWIHEDDIPDLDHAVAMLIAVRNAIYETGNIEDLEDCLEELLATFDLSMPLTKPKLIAKINKTLIEAS